MSNWISVEDNPIPKKGEFLVYFDEPLLCARVHSMVKEGAVGVVAGRFDFDAPNITHWMPLPEPPEAE